MGMQYMNIGFKQILGALLFECRIFLWQVLFRGILRGNRSWIFVRNRNEKLVSHGNLSGVKCDWEFTSNLYIDQVFPKFGYWLFNRALADFPVRLIQRPLKTSSHDPSVSFLIGHRGKERIPLLLATLNSIAAQRDCQVECIVVEQDDERLVEAYLPDWVTYVFSPMSEKGAAYSRSRAFNVAAQAASSKFLIFHDNDILVPDVYGKEMCNHLDNGFDVVNLKRFIFFLDQTSSEKICQSKRVVEHLTIESIMQNSEAGGSVGVNAQAFFELGGFNESFIGWGGEDNEFWERAQTRKVNPFSYLPMIHLWHAPQADKRQTQVEGIAKHRALFDAPVEERIRSLQQQFKNSEGI